MNRLLVVEGMDNSGKSTLIERLTSDMKMVSMKNGKRPKSLEDMLAYTFTVEEVAKTFPVILDRWAFISEPIYGPICRQTDIVGWPRYELTNYIQQADPVIVYCRPPDEVIMNFGDRPQMDGVIKFAPRLNDAYDGTMKLLQESCTVIPYDWTTGPRAYEGLIFQLKEIYS